MFPSNWEKWKNSLAWRSQHWMKPYECWKNKSKINCHSFYGKQQPIIFLIVLVKNLHNSWKTYPNLLTAGCGTQQTHRTYKPCLISCTFFLTHLSRLHSGAIYKWHHPNWLSSLPCHTKAVLFCTFGHSVTRFGSQMVWFLNGRLFKNQLSKSPVFEWFWFLKGRFSDSHCTLSFVDHPNTWQPNPRQPNTRH